MITSVPQCHPSEFGILNSAVWAHVPGNKTSHGFSKLKEFSSQLEVALAANASVARLGLTASLGNFTVSAHFAL